jgi:pilus assembly protein CpaB
MAMNATLDTSNGNRKFIMLAVVLGLMGAILVYVAFSRDTSSSGGDGVSSATTAVVVAKTDIAARTKVTPDMLEVKLIPADAVSEMSFTDAAQVVNQVTRFPISANQQILSSQVIPPSGSAGVSRALSFAVPTGKRAFAIHTTAIAGVGGLVLPGDYIDVLALFDIPSGNDVRNDFAVQTILQNVEVLAVDQAIVDTVGGDTTGPNGQRSRNTEARPVPDAKTLTLLLTPEEAQQMFLAEAHGELRFALRSFGDGKEDRIRFLTLPELIPNLP